MKFKREITITLLSVCIACSPAARRNVGAAVTPGATPQTTKLMIFGGQEHKTYLGCLNCSQYTIDSVFNQYGNYGSPYATESVWNHYGDFGSRYSNYGACNPYADDPPVIVDSDGNFYGRLTLNAYHVQLGAGAKYRDWLVNKVCEE